MKNFDVFVFCCSSEIHRKNWEIKFIYKVIYFVITRKKSITCLCGLQDECVIILSEIPNVVLIYHITIIFRMSSLCICYSSLEGKVRNQQELAALEGKASQELNGSKTGGAGIVSLCP